MTDPLPESTRTAFERHEAYDLTEGTAVLRSVVFDATVGVTDNGDYTLTVRAPTLDSATADDVGPTVADDWLRTLCHRARDAPKATRASVDVDEFTAKAVNGEVHITYTFALERPDTAAHIAKTFAEFVEGTYVEGLIPGYEYEPPVTNLLADASQGGKRGTPL